jgi:hypothetical protein
VSEISLENVYMLLGAECNMAGQRATRRQKDISKLLREKKNIQPLKYKKSKYIPVKKNIK